MKNVYENCPVFESNRFLLRFVIQEDTDDLLEVYSDKNALPFFNSDNCDGDNFYYPDTDRMKNAIDFWLRSYETKWFVRWTIIDKTCSKAIGTIEMFHRFADDDFNHAGVLRLDVRSNYEKSDILRDLFELFIPPAYELFDCNEIITKVPVYAVERINAAQSFGFTKSEKLLIGTNDHYAYNNYWTINKDR
ncbi:MAG: N-acetyltransferase [Ruminococcus sp.]|uniref:GNAT family N-acetyltransferase n=1 Tax=Ruminococcus sp. TaxID=41978 RepID=UPI0025EEEFE2|nr:N-acetyltransferase [Ruminococcus sp.]MBR5683779.1 N-acetyltransferase [Ruminococcus sp.]